MDTKSNSVAAPLATPPFHDRAFAPVSVVPQPDTSGSIDEMPKQLHNQFQLIKQWAEANRREAVRETVLYWALKVPVIIASAGYGAMMYYELKWMIAVAGAIASACALIDGIYKPGALRNFHHRAYFELNTLTDDLMDRWNTAVLRKEENLNMLAANLIDVARTRKSAISNYLVDAEATLGKGGEKKHNDAPATN